MKNFIQPGKMSFILGGQFGSCGKGAASAYLMTRGFREPDIITVNSGVQSGHTSVHNGRKRVLFHLPTSAMFTQSCPVYLNAGAIIDVDVLFREIEENPDFAYRARLMIHPNAAIITQADRDSEMDNSSAQTKIASTRKGVGAALANKVLRKGTLAKDDERLRPFIRRLDLNDQMANDFSVLCEVPQGVSLSLNASPFYPHTTSRDCTVAQAMSDAGVHPHFMGQTMLVLRTFPIRVGAIKELRSAVDLAKANISSSSPDALVELGNSGGVYPDQREISFADLGVEAEITTVTKRVRRIFTWSDQQVADSIRISRPDVVFLSFCDYLVPPAFGPESRKIKEVVAKIRHMVGSDIPVLTAYGPTTDDVREG